MRRLICLPLWLLTAILYGQNPSATTGPVFDSVGHKVAYIYPDGKKETYAYDPQWRMIRFRDRAGKLTTFSYVLDGSLTVSHPKSGNSDR